MKSAALLFFALAVAGSSVFIFGAIFNAPAVEMLGFIMTAPLLLLMLALIGCLVFSFLLRPAQALACVLLRRMRG